MLARVFALLPLAALVAAEYQCNTGTAYCCNTSGTQGDIDQALIAAGQGGLVGTVGAVVGVTAFLGCTGIIGTGSSCDQKPMCCEDNYGVSLVGVSCTDATVL